jgi:hypothetical protein
MTMSKLLNSIQFEERILNEVSRKDPMQIQVSAEQPNYSEICPFTHSSKYFKFSHCYNYDLLIKSVRIKPTESILIGLHCY